jgi:exopolysaccharide production protein ExoY
MYRILHSQKLSRRTLQSLHHHLPKRLFDLCFSMALLILLAPLFLCITLAIRFSTKGNAIYAQFRLGREGRVFRCYKFRTMYTDADQRLRDLLSTDSDLREEWIQNQKFKEDPRIFPLGKWLRRTSLDELPQFWNVLRGDLSIVGPRPYMVIQKRQLGLLAPKILSVRPGITGLWQTSGRNQTTFQDRIHLDAEYVDKHSFWFDLFLVLKTIPQILLLTGI